MIHISDKIYITYAEASVGPGSPDKLPECFVRVIDKGLSGASDVHYYKNQIAFGKTLEDVIEELGGDKAFFKTIKEKVTSGESPKVILYLDEVAMLEFLVRWWKGLFPSLTAEGGYALYKIFADSESLRSSKHLNFLDITVKSDSITFDKFQKTYWDENKKMFTEKFDHYKAFDLDQDLKDGCSVEYHVLDYMANGNKLGAPLISKLAHLYKKEFIKEVSNVVMVSQEFLYYLALEDSTISEGGQLDGTSLKDVLEKNSKYRAFLDTSIQNNMSGYEHVKQNYELDQLAKNLIDVEISINKHLGVDLRTIESDNPCLYHYLNSKEDPSLEDILKEEISGKSKFRLFSNLARKNKLNPYVIPAFKNLLNKNPSHSLVKEFSF